MTSHREMTRTRSAQHCGAQGGSSFGSNLRAATPGLQPECLNIARYPALFARGSKPVVRLEEIEPPKARSAS
jgi:hypothetical protein